ncbi:uncharacterized protein JCM15063_004413 [Sporobolomyces koalae]|uniref:uncharacterized protein n=1 Tax=Sporobolomyces koalae TaxID=500713 RepID=UPI0031722BAE
MTHRLSKKLLESQLEALDLCLSLFPQPGELTLTEETERFVPSLREWLQDGTRDGSMTGVERDGPTVWANEIAFDLQLTFHRDDDDESSSSTFPISLHVRLPTVADVRTSDLPPPAEYNLAHPAWLSRAKYDELSSSLPKYNSSTFTENSDFVLGIIDSVRDRVPTYVPTREEEDALQRNKRSGRKQRKTASTPNEDEPEFRVWLWFPSLSTREKRDDIVTWAADYDLTGFVLAGKPAVMCLEGTENNIQEYMAEIKSNSWADIPSFQKKVSERFRTPLIKSTASLSSSNPSHRIFTDMSEITSLIAQSGHRGNRGEMAEVREFLEMKGLGEAFGAVVGGGQFTST